MYFEDIRLGMTLQISPATITKEKMMAFARDYDNIPLHTDEEYAKASPFGALIAPGVMSFMSVWFKFLETDFFGRELLAGGDGYFIHRDGKLLGIGKASGNFIDTVISVQPGLGETGVLALAELLTEDTVELMVAGANERAVRLYERMGFLKVKELTRWYRVL